MMTGKIHDQFDHPIHDFEIQLELNSSSYYYYLSYHYV